MFRYVLGNVYACGLRRSSLKRLIDIIASPVGSHEEGAERKRPAEKQLGVNMEDTEKAEPKSQSSSAERHSRWWQ